MSRNNLYCQKPESLTYISAADSMGLCSDFSDRIEIPTANLEFSTRASLKKRQLSSGYSEKQPTTGYGNMTAKTGKTYICMSLSGNMSTSKQRQV